jgi:hypothetical protein
VTPLLVVAVGLGAIATGTLLLRAYGARMRVGRLLAVTPAVTIAEARALADGPRRYVRVDGRLDADDEFPDENHRPLVLRRRRLEVRTGRSWRLLDEQLDRVPFRVREGMDQVDVDGAALDAGLVTLVREALGTAAEAAEAVRPGLLAGVPATAPVRLRVEQLSSVEHAAVLGTPVATGDGRVTMTAGTGRPLVVCTLERDEAMRVLAEGRRARPVVAAAALATGLALVAVGLLWALAAGGFA